MKNTQFIVASALALGLLTACQPEAEENKPNLVENAANRESSIVEEASPTAALVTNDRLLNAASEPEQWMTMGGTYEERHYSELNEITTDNVDQLSLSWFADYDTNLSQQGAPLYIDGVIYVSTAWSKVYAYDARTGEQLWQYDPKTPGEWAVKVCCGIVNRGVAAYEGKIYLGTLDGYLVAIDAASGEELWRELTVDQDEQYTITSAPRIVKGKVLIGNSGAEFGVRGYLGAFNADTGEPLWRFYTVPGNPELGFENEQMELAASTWGGEWWELGGGGTVWDAIVYDVENDLVFFGTGNGTPWNQRERDPSGGDNLFIASILAVRPDTGEYVWHYQTTPGDTWDYDAMSPMMLLDLEFFEGEGERRVLVQPNKNGFMYVLDAATGDLLKADPFTAVNWAEGVDLDTGRPIENPAARYDTTDPFNLAPGVQGAHGWHANAWNPETGLVYIAAQRAYFVMKGAENFVANPVGSNLGLDFSAAASFIRDNPDAPREFVGYVSAWDPIKGEEVWRSEENNGPTGSVLATAGGLVFSGGGNNTNEFRAYDAVTGEKVWQVDTQTGVVAAPMTYELDGKQYVAVSVGINQAGNYYAPSYSRMLVFTLNGEGQLPEAITFTPPPLNPPALTASVEEIAIGAEKYGQTCSLCHGNGGQNRGANFPNLLVSPMLHSQAGFDQIVLDGVRTERGMVSFADRLSSEDTAAIRSYLIAQATDLMNTAPLAPAVEAVEDAHDDLMAEDE